MANELNPLAASARIQNELEGRGWWLATPFPHRSGASHSAGRGVANPARLAAMVPKSFLIKNGIRRIDVQEALARALHGYVVVDSAAANAHVTNIYSGKVENVAKKIEVNNAGQWVGNVDSPSSTANVERQQQVHVTPEDERALREHVNDPEIQSALALGLPKEQKVQIIVGAPGEGEQGWTRRGRRLCREASCGNTATALTYSPGLIDAQARRYAALVPVD